MRIVLLGGALALASLCNCYSTAKFYTPGQPYYGQNEVPAGNFTDEDPQFESGEPYLLIDKPGHYFFSLFAKLILWNWSVGDHDISQETKEYLQNYMTLNGLTGVKVRFNQYAPVAEFMRLTRNGRVHWGLRYSLGLLSWLVYTIFPERLFAGLIGGDHYNQYTNTINLYSNSVPIALHEGGHAKDFEMRVHRNAYALLRAVPVAGALYQEAVASDDAVVYLRMRCEKERELQAYKELAPAYGTYLLGPFLAGIGTLVAALPGHGYGYYKRNKEKKIPLPGCGGLKVP